MRKSSKTIQALLVPLALALSAPAYAQGEPEDEPTEETSDEPAAEEGAADEKPAEGEGEEGATAAEVDPNAGFARIADDEETIYAVQRKAYLINGKFEITPLISFSFTDRFVDTFGFGASIAYHLAENFALEISGAYMLPNESSLTTEILDEGQLTPEIAKLTQMLWTAGIGIQWSPIYGKLQLFGASLGNFQFYISLGGGIGQSRVQCTSGRPLDPNRGFDPDICPAVEDPTAGELQFVYEPASLRFMGSFGGGVRFYFTESIGLKFEVKDYIFVSRVYRPGTTEPTQRFTDAVRNNIFGQIGLAFLFGGEEN